MQTNTLHSKALKIKLNIEESYIHIIEENFLAAEFACLKLLLTQSSTEFVTAQWQGHVSGVVTAPFNYLTICSLVLGNWNNLLAGTCEESDVN